LPGSPETPTGGFVYDRHMISTLRRAGGLADVLVVPGTWPYPGKTTIAAAAARLARLPSGAALIVDGLAFSPLLEVLEAHCDRLRLIALIHHPLADELGPDGGDYARLFDRERQALALTRGVIVTSATTARRLADFDVPENKIRVVRPGVAAQTFSVCRPRGAPPSLLCVASLTPRKGQDVLLRALARLRHLRWRLRLVGPERDPAFSRRLRRLARAFCLADRVSLAGALAPARLRREYRAADLFVLPSHHEGFGMVVAEAAAYGLPIVASDAGAIAEASAGSRRRLVAPGDPVALAQALRCCLTARQAYVRRSASRWRSWEDVGRELVAGLDAFGVP
jgi:glycosyltransferase involved in cell wall biosynthesis